MFGSKSNYPLQVFDLPHANKWSTENIVTTTEVFIEMFVLGTNGIPDIDKVLKLMSMRIEDSRERLIAKRKKGTLAKKRKTQFSAKQLSLLAFVKRRKTS